MIDSDGIITSICAIAPKPSGKGTVSIAVAFVKISIILAAAACKIDPFAPGQASRKTFQVVLMSISLVMYSRRVKLPKSCITTSIPVAAFTNGKSAPGVTIDIASNTVLSFAKVLVPTKSMNGASSVNAS